MMSIFLLEGCRYKLWREQTARWPIGKQEGHEGPAATRSRSEPAAIGVGNTAAQAESGLRTAP